MMARRGSRRISKVDKASKATANKAQPQGKKVMDDGAEKPTPEMLARVDYEYGDVKTEMNVKIGAAYRRRPLYLTMAKRRGTFTAVELSALETYRMIYDRCERSPVASCLSQGGGGGFSPSYIAASPAIVEARRKLSMVERGLGPMLSTMRDVVLKDLSFSAIAMERYGCRRRSWIVIDEPVMRDGKPLKIDGKPVTRPVHREDIVPRSGRDRERVSDEFRRGLALLVTSVSRLSGPGVDELWVQPRDDGSAIIHRASIAPNGLFRMWGPRPAVANVLDSILQEHGDSLVYRTPEAARDALVTAALMHGPLHCLDPDELAA